MLTQRSFDNTRLYWVGLLLFGFTVSPLAAQEDVPLMKASVASFAGAVEGRTVIGRRDAFIDRLSRFDLQSRMKTDKEVTADEFLRFAAAEVRGWEEAEAKLVTAVLDSVRGRLREFNLPLPKAISLIKTTGKEEAEAAYTRGESIIFPQKVLKRNRDQLERLMIHELFHVLSRANPELRDRLYEIVGFHPCGELKLPTALRDRKITNPDAPAITHRIELLVNDRRTSLTPVLYSSTEKYDKAKGGSFFRYLTFRLMAIEQSDGGWRPVEADGEPVMFDPRKTPAYLERIGKNTQYIIHPDEILADNFVHLLMKTEDLASPGIVEQMREVLSNDRGAKWPELPATDAAVEIPAQTWPQRPGNRTVRVSMYYPRRRRENVNAKTGVMLTLHNWGGEGCAGTASPTALADRLNVVALCVDYLQSGRQASIEDPEPYDCGYLQALDALRALWFVVHGLRENDIAFDDRRLFCTGGSGGGNVTLMANKLAPRTFACVIDMCGMKKLSDDIAFNLPGGTGLNARWSQDPKSPNYLSQDHQEIRFVGHPKHLQVMKELGSTTKIIVVHGAKDTTCPFVDAEEMVANMRAAGLAIEPHFIQEKDLDGKVFTSTGHALGNRTEIVFRVAEKYLATDGSEAVRLPGPSDFARREAIRYPTTNGQFVISYERGYPVGVFQAGEKADK